MTNYEKWLKYTEGLSSPQNYIDWGWRFIIASALQRRCWYGSDHMPVYPNMYIVLVGKAGVGKGIVITPATELLKHHKKKDFSTVKESSTDQEKFVISQTEKANLDSANEAEMKVKGGGEKVEPVLFPYAPDATTFEALVEGMSKSGRRINYDYFDVKGDKQLGIYFHCSMYFSLPELASLLRKRTEDTVNYLLGVYDCPLNYEYKTKTRGEARVRRGCLNLIAGTTPSFMETVFDDQLIDQGFSSRTFFIFAPKNRKNVAFPEPLTKEQTEHKDELLNHIKNLAKLYGRVTVEPETVEWIQNWWNETENNKHLRSNISPKLEAYYARKQIHMIKVAMVEHFSESLSMTMSLETVKRACAILEKEEKNMHMALTFEGSNPLGKLTDRIGEYLKTKKLDSFVGLTIEFWKDLPDGAKSMTEILAHLITRGEVEEENDEDGKLIYRSLI